MKISKHSLILLTVGLITFCIQTTDVKLGFVKISELILLFLTPFLLKKPINKFFFYFLLFFTVETVLGLIVTANTDFEILGISRIKAPYIITIARYLELISCISLGIISFRLFQDNPNDSKKIINLLVKWNLYITVIFVFLYFMVILRLLPMQHSIVVYENNRLRGLYVEGGPYGLMLSFIFMLTFFQEKTRKRRFTQIFLFAVIALCAESKAGILFTVIWLILLNLEYLRNRFKGAIFPLIIMCVIGFFFIFINVSAMYVKEFNRIKKSVHERPTDPYLILGRVSGTYIVPQMIRHNPVFGIGLGNYPLVRNNNEYRMFFPKPPKELKDIDSHGYGGLVDVIVDMGVTGFLVFMFIIYSIYLSLKRINKGPMILLGFVFVFGFGVQLIFLYPWILLGIVLAYQNRYIDEVSN